MNIHTLDDYVPCKRVLYAKHAFCWSVSRVSCVYIQAFMVERPQTNRFPSYLHSYVIVTKNVSRYTHASLNRAEYTHRYSFIKKYHNKLSVNCNPLYIMYIHILQHEINNYRKRAPEKTGNRAAAEQQVDQTQCAHVKI